MFSAISKGSFPQEPFYLPAPSAPSRPTGRGVSRPDSPWRPTPLNNSTRCLTLGHYLQVKLHRHGAPRAFEAQVRTEILFGAVSHRIDPFDTHFAEALKYA